MKGLVLAVLLVTGCSGGGSASPAASPTGQQLPKPGIVARPLCLALRASIQGNLETVATDRAAGDEAGAARAQAQVDADVVSARRIQGCGIDDLVPSSQR